MIGLRRFLKILVGVAFTLTATHSNAQTIEDSALYQMDSVQISLLTCSPGVEVWSLYGHTAIRVYDPIHAQDVVINYGMFNYNQKNFILRFVFGLTDYEMGIEPFNLFMMEYARQGRQIVQQTLRLSNEEKKNILQALTQNYEQERVYRYNFFYDNCTTRARDILISNMNSRVNYQIALNVSTSYREMVHQWNGEHRWARFGNDLLLGLKADRKTDYKQQQFLPDSLRKYFDNATIVDTLGNMHSFVTSTKIILKKNTANVPDNPNLWDKVSPSELFGALLLIIILLEIIEIRNKKPFWLIDVTLLTIDGLAGLVLFAMIFSQHPTVNLNLQILLLNPLSLIFVYSTISSEVKNHFHWYWNLFAACIVLFFIGNFFQNYAEGINFLALTLLSRCITNQHLQKKPHNR